MATDYYELLGVRKDASDEELKRAYRRRARELHPDSTGGDPEAERRFKEVALAYEVLRDPERRRRYDRFGPEGVDATAMTGDFFTGGLGDLFDAFFSATGSPRRTRNGPMRGNDAEVVMELSFREAVFGVQRDLTVDVAVACPDCSGSGARAGTTPIRCPDCGGSGELRQVRPSILGQVMTAVRCVRCGGTGESIASPCAGCRGDGRKVESRTFTVDVPAGVDHGTALRLAGRGPAGPRGGPPGDLFVHLSVAPDARFERRGADLVCTLPVTFAQAALGAVVPLETLDGVEQVTVPAGTQSGTVLRLRGLGVPSVRGRGRGDVLVGVTVVTPAKLSKEQEDLLRQLAAVGGEEVAPPGEGFMSKLRSAFG